MRRIHKAPLTETELWQDGPPVRVRDLVNITGLSREKICDDVRAGRLPAKHCGTGSSLYLVQRSAARTYIVALGHEPQMNVKRHSHEDKTEAFT